MNYQNGSAQAIMRNVNCSIPRLMHLRRLLDCTMRDHAPGKRASLTLHADLEHNNCKLSGAFAVMALFGRKQGSL
jgi:hypothetical protein